jgi:hypothetical protein
MAYGLNIYFTGLIYIIFYWIKEKINSTREEVLFNSEILMQDKKNLKKLFVFFNYFYLFSV